MKRIKAACVQQVLHFTPKEGIQPPYAAQAVQEEVAQYKERMDRIQTRYKILREEIQPDGSVILEVKKQYNASPIGTYLDGV